MIAQRSNFASRRAFTLVEMLLATTLLALLMVGLLAVIADFTASAHAAPAKPAAGNNVAETTPLPNEQIFAAWVRLLEDDLAHAQTVVSPHDNELVVTGYAALSLNDEPRSHRPVEIIYSLEEIAQNRCLIRRQTLLDDLSGRNVRRDLVLCGIQRFTVSHQRANSLPSSTPTTSTTQNAEKGRMALQVWTAGQSTPVIERLLSLPTAGEDIAP